MIIQVASRPAMRDWQAAKQEVHRLRQKLSEATNLKEVRKHMDTRTLIQKDKVLPLRPECASLLFFSSELNLDY
jgi:hypothetical protein